MDSMSYRNNRPAARPNEPVEVPSAPQPVASAARTSHSVKNTARSKSKRPLQIGAAIVVIALMAFAAWFLLSRVGGGSTIESNKYQAVFFTNGQVYFGKLSTINDNYMRLKSVYYLQTKSTTDSTQTTPQSASKQNASDVELIKLGNEIHGPEDEMIIAKDQVLFFENLKPAGTVSQTITNYQKKN